MFKYNRLAVFAVIAFVLSGIFTSEINAQKVRLRSKITPNCGSSSSLKFADIWADGNIAVMGSYNCRGAFIFDISNPDAPTLSNWYNPTRPGTASTKEQFLEAIVVGNRGYFGSGNGGGVYIVDLTNPASPQLLGRVHSTSGNGHNSIHEMMVFEQNGATYLLENFNGFSSKILKIINITNPASPVFVRDINPTEISWVHAFHIRGNRMYTSGWGSTSVRGRTEIYDIANIATQAPTLLGFIEDAVSPASGNSMHSSWTSEDGIFLYSAREVSSSNGPNPGDVRIYNVSNPATPLLVNRVTMSDLGLNAVTPHNPVVMGDKLYVSWYQAGLQVFDISKPDTVNRIGQYDTYEPAFVGRDDSNVGDVQNEPWDIMCGGDSLQNALPTTYEGAWAVYPFLGEDRILIGDLNAGLLVVDTRGTSQPLKNIVSDYDGDKKTDISVYSPATANWWIKDVNGGMTSTLWGGAGDIAVPADYDGDGKTDIAVFRPSNGVWYVMGSTGSHMIRQWGAAGDVPISADFDADGKADFAVYRPSNGVWYIDRTTLGQSVIGWGVAGDKPIVGDYDGDGKADIAVFRPSNGVWYILQSSSSQPTILGFGMNGDKPVVGDFSGDGRAEVSVFRPSNGTWYILDLASNVVTYTTWGMDGDIPVPGDYDGDSKTDVAIFRPSSGLWFILRSSNGGYHVNQFGQPVDQPLPGTINPQ